MTENMAEEKVQNVETTIVRKPVDLQRMKLEKLMKNPEKLAFIPEMHKDKKFPDAPEFVRNVMGSSAGAGSGEFHVYRHIRRREYARNLYLQKAREKNTMDDEYHIKLEQGQKEGEAKTAKKRAKRQRLKMNQKARKKTQKESSKKESSSESSSTEESDNSGDEAKDNVEAETNNVADR